MNERRFQVEVAPAGSGRVRIILAGDLDVAADDALAAGYRRVASGPGSSEIVLDFHDVGYINSTGIALIVRLLAEARRDRRAVTAVGLSDHYRRIFEITRLADYVRIEADEAAPAGREERP
ncbi:MAG TPA: STAS domain-containing protein [Candidatus Limnocylindrales bacterium]|nr:STAS domain-containing protein [Candidatus Limnocylindrales bacterium]